MITYYFILQAKQLIKSNLHFRKPPKERFHLNTA